MRIALALGVLAVATSAAAHGMRTAYLELAEDGTGAVLATWKTTVRDDRVTPRMPQACVPDAAASMGGGNVRVFSLRCPGGLAGRTLGVDGLGPVLTEAVVRVLRPDGTILSRVLVPAAATWTVPVAESSLAVLRQYVRLGVEHIAFGIDHLLFLLALVLYVRRPRDVLITETAFTVSHTASFGATALGLIHASVPAAEACIALSLILVALEVGDGAVTRDARWYGPVIALVFGLVHGLGFAGALSAVGLPDGAAASALAGFGLGVELGQVVFLALVLLVLTALERAAATAVPRVAIAGSYLVGITGTYWFFQRVWTCFA